MLELHTLEISFKIIATFKIPFYTMPRVYSENIIKGTLSGMTQWLPKSVKYWHQMHVNRNPCKQINKITLTQRQTELGGNTHMPQRRRATKFAVVMAADYMADPFEWFSSHHHQCLSGSGSLCMELRNSKRVA